MGIPYWRNVRYTDDGCSKFQCLSCKNTWEARTSPAHTTYKCGTCDHCKTGVYKNDNWDCHGKKEFAVYVPYFVFCPCCSVKWVGEMVRPENHRKAIIQRILDNEPYETRDERYRRSQPTKEWIIESKNKAGHWLYHTTLRWCTSAKEAHVRLLKLRQDELDEYNDTDPMWQEIKDRHRRIYRARLRKVR